jgi:hypothetical protein
LYWKVRFDFLLSSAIIRAPFAMMSSSFWLRRSMVKYSITARLALLVISISMVIVDILCLLSLISEGQSNAIRALRAFKSYTLDSWAPVRSRKDLSSPPVVTACKERSGRDREQAKRFSLRSRNKWKAVPIRKIWHGGIRVLLFASKRMTSHGIEEHSMPI